MGETFLDEGASLPDSSIFPHPCRWLHSESQGQHLPVNGVLPSSTLQREDFPPSSPFQCCLLPRSGLALFFTAPPPPTVTLTPVTNFLTFRLLSHITFSVWITAWYLLMGPWWIQKANCVSSSMLRSIQMTLIFKRSLQPCSSFSFSKTWS